MPKPRSNHNDDEQADSKKNCHLLLNLMKVLWGEHAQRDFLSDSICNLAKPLIQADSSSTLVVGLMSPRKLSYYHFFPPIHLRSTPSARGHPPEYSWSRYNYGSKRWLSSRRWWSKRSRSLGKGPRFTELGDKWKTTGKDSKGKTQNMYQLLVLWEVRARPSFQHLAAIWGNLPQLPALPRCQWKDPIR